MTWIVILLLAIGIFCIWLRRINALVGLGLLEKTRREGKVCFQLRERGKKLKAAKTVQVVDRGWQKRRSVYAA